MSGSALWMLGLLHYCLLGWLQLLGQFILVLGIFHRREQFMGRDTNTHRDKELEEDLHSNSSKRKGNSSLRECKFSKARKAKTGVQNYSPRPANELLQWAIQTQAGIPSAAQLSCLASSSGCEIFISHTPAVAAPGRLIFFAGWAGEPRRSNGVTGLYLLLLICIK
ncbi:hypothetical protein VPH35_068696 [Triticum aestivum]